MVITHHTKQLHKIHRRIPRTISNAEDHQSFEPIRPVQTQMSGNVSTPVMPNNKHLPFVRVDVMAMEFIDSSMINDFYFNIISFMTFTLSV